MSVPGVSVGDMAHSARTTHTCVFFDDGEPELVCVCGGRAIVLTDGDDVVLLPVEVTVEAAGRELALTA